MHTQRFNNSRESLQSTLRELFKVNAGDDEESQTDEQYSIASLSGSSNSEVSEITNLCSKLKFQQY